MTSAAQTTVLPETPPASASAAPRRGRAFVLVAIAAAAFLTTTALVRSRLSLQAVPDIQEKISFFANHGEQFDTVFVGSSRIYHQIVPKLFDELMAKAGFPTHSYNLGMSAMLTPEDTFVMEAAFAKRKNPLKFVLVETTRPIETDYSWAGMNHTLRVAYWHDFKRLKIMSRAIAAKRAQQAVQDPAALQKDFDTFLYHLRLFASNTFNTGRGVDWLKSERDLIKMTFRRHPKSPGRSRKYDDGFGVLNPPIQIDDSQWAYLQTSIKRPTLHDYADKESQHELQAKKQLIASLGGRMFAVMPPVAGGPTFAPDPKFGEPIPELDFSDPKKFPELFERKNRQDSGHLNFQGAEIFTRLLVDRLVQILRSK